MERLTRGVLYIGLGARYYRASSSWYKRQGGSVLAWMNIPDVPCFGESSTIVGVSSELYSAIVVNFRHCIRTFVEIRAVFVVWLVRYHDLVSDRVGMIFAFLVFTLVVLDDELLLSIPYVFPIRLERYVEHCVPTEHQLGGRCS